MLDVAERDCDALHRLGLLAVDLLRELALAQAQAVGELLQRLAPFDPVRLEVGRRRGRDLLRAPGEILAHLRCRRALLLQRGLKPVGVGVDPRLDLRRQLGLPLRDPRELVSEALLEAAQVRRPLGDPLLDVPLCLRQRLGELGARVALALRHVDPSLLRDPPLLVRERGKRLRARERKRPLELVGAELDLACDDLVERGLATADLVLQRARRRAGAPQCEERRDRGANRDERGDDGDDDGGGHAL